MVPLGDKASDEEALALLPADVADAIRNARPAQPVPVADAVGARDILGKCGAAAAAAAMPELSRDVIYRGVLQCFRLVGRGSSAIHACQCPTLMTFHGTAEPLRAPGSTGEPMCCLKSAAAMSPHKQAVCVWINTVLRTRTIHGIFLLTAPFIVVLHLPLAGVHGREDGGRAAAAGACIPVARSRRQCRSCRGASGGYFRPASRYASSCSLLFPGSAAQCVIGKGVLGSCPDSTPPLTMQNCFEGAEPGLSPSC